MNRSRKKLAGCEAENQSEYQSKSAKKRESAALQKLGEELAEMAADARVSLDLPDALAEALAQYDRIRDREGARRQRQYIGKLMRGVDTEKIAQAIAQRRMLKAVHISSMQRAEKLRAEILGANPVELDKILEGLAENLPPDSKACYLEKLRNCIEKARNDRSASRELFKLLVKGAE